jgi:hypothetical protein
METNLRRVFARAAPAQIRQKAFEADDGHLRRLARLPFSAKAEARDLFEYTQDLLYTEIDSALLRYLLPFCLEAWSVDLRGTATEYGGFVEQFYPVLADRQVFDKHLTSDQSATVSKFMRQSILDEIDAQRGAAFAGSASRPYRWIRALTTYGVLLPDVEPLWTEWWSPSTIGRAIATVQYISCLMYSENENPIFAPWTRERGGGPPCLWAFEGHLYNHRWMDANVAFLRRVLTPRLVNETLARAVDRLVGEPEHGAAAEVFSDLPLCASTLESRCDDLSRILETQQKSVSLFEWSQ